MDSSTANSVSNSPISSVAQSPPPQQHQEVKVSSPIVPQDSKEEVVKDPVSWTCPFFQFKKDNPIRCCWLDLESQQIEKFKRYEVEARRHLMSKYFSDKTIFGGNIFDVKMTIDGEQVKVSRFPGYQSYADPANFNDDSGSNSVSTVETPTPSANGQQPS
ncbi:uncharacterized protein LOC132632816 isoform X1 [Lycium barbarum]|uniref:uncharacterized protein LOC132632816 isoform X1 n=1 Tax=Lycium barbarum TaxID=112863 RepID=UPI00293F11A9|nr:uncharacterized protein LOC132632816 isoform X1 [Lycium barbarum]